MFLIIGNTTMDLFISGLERLPGLGGDEFTVANLAFCDQPLALVLGGNGANTAFALARLGAPVALGSAIGQDTLGQIVSGWLKEAGVNLEGLVRRQSAATPTTTVITDAALNRLAFHHPGASASFQAADVPAGLLARATTLLISGYPLLPAWRPQGAADTLAQARQAGALTALDIGPAIGRPAALAELRPLLANIDYLLCNEHELAVCTGGDDLEANLKTMLAAGANCLVIKQGRKGALIRQAGSATGLTAPGFEVEARFTVGAGDSFNAGFLFGRGQGWSLAQAARFGNAVAALVVSGSQGVLGCPTLAEVERLLNKDNNL